jgi:lipopolysaccharide transport system permease protein
MKIPPISLQLDFGVYRMSDIVIIEPGRQEINYWRDLWHYRELFYVLAWRDVAVRYKQTVIGIAWAVIRPLLTTLVFAVIFGHIAKLPSEGNVPYPLLVFAGMLPWTFFSTGLTDASNSLIGNANLISKVYFPRLIVPVAAIVVSFIDFLISFILMLGLMAWYGFAPGWEIALLPAFVIFAAIACIGPSLWITALNIKYRDFRLVIPFIVQLGLYVSPVGFSSRIVPPEWQLLYALNPMVGVIDGFRWCILGGQNEINVPGLALSFMIAIVFLWFGIRRFRKTESSFADLI